MKIKKIFPFVLAPVLTLFVIGVFFALNDIFPFGSKTISWCDMNQQTIPLLMDLKDILDGKTSFFYSAGNAGGMNFWGVFLFFLASPLYITVKFIAKSDLVYLVNVLFAFKLSLCALSAVIYLKLIHKKLTDCFCVILSLMYAFCGYGIMYYQTLVWLDIMALFPILVLGIEIMFKKNKPALYCVTLIAVTVINFYLSFMIVIYLLLVIPLFIKIRCSGIERKKMAVNFILSSAVAMLVAAPVWLCSFFQILGSARGEHSLLGLLYKPLFDNTKNKLCVIMCTALCTAVIPFFIKNKIIREPAVKYNIFVLALLLIPVFIDPINKMWHMGSYQCFPFRYGFIVIFTMITLTAHYFEKINNQSKGSCGFACITIAMTVGFISLAVYIVKEKKEELLSFVNILRIDNKSFKLLFSVFLLGFIIYTICIMLVQKKLLGRSMLCVIISVVFLGEAYVSLSVNVGYAANDGGVLNTSAALEYDVGSEPCYRAKTEKKYLHVNMLGGLGYNSPAHYTSLTDENYMFAMKKMGYSSYWMEVGANGGTALTDALMSVKYSIGADYDFKSFYNVTDIEGELDRGVNQLCCPMGTISDITPEQCRFLEDDKRLNVQKKLAEQYFGTSRMFTEYEPSFTAGGKIEYENSKYNIYTLDDDSEFCQLRYTIDVKGRQILYFDIFDKLSNRLAEEYYGAAEIYVNGSCLTKNYPEQKNNGILTLGEFNDTTVEILIIINKDISVKSFGIFGIDVDILKSCTDLLNSSRGCDLFIDGRKIYGTCDSRNGKWLYMSVPYDKGLKAYVNGKTAQIFKIYDSFCAVKLEDGVNSVELDFLPYGMKISLMLTLLGVILCLIWKKIGSEKICRINKMSVNAILLCKVEFCFVILAVYILPVILRIAALVSKFI